jgi:curved DNA-binding protein CbpA
MSDPATLHARLQAIVAQSYYEILRVPSSAPVDEIKAAFHEFALACHPDQHIDDLPEFARAAAEIFKRGVEAYRVLANPVLRARYDDGLIRGKLRFVPGEREEAPPPPTLRTLEDIATSPRAKHFARKADRLIASGKLDEARIALVTALQHDYENEELKERLTVLYEALALEPM